MNVRPFAGREEVRVEKKKKGECIFTNSYIHRRCSELIRGEVSKLWGRRGQQRLIKKI